MVFYNLTHQLLLKYKYNKNTHFISYQTSIQLLHINNNELNEIVTFPSIIDKFMLRFKHLKKLSFKF